VLLVLKVDYNQGLLSGNINPLSLSGKVPVVKGN
jgi:hypothetical protein